MTTSRSQEKVIIVGAGLAGLALAQVLRKAKIPFEIYERDGADQRFQGWGIALDQDKCIDALNPLLPEDLPPFSAASANNRIGVRDNFTVINSVAGESLGVILDFPIGHPQASSNCDRSQVRRNLLQNLDLHYSKTFDRYEETADSVTVYFKDGTSTQGTALVGADGSSSEIRRQLLKGFQGWESGYTVIFGEVDVSKEHKDKLLFGSTTGLLIAGAEEKANCLLKTHYPDGGARFCWCYSWKSPEHWEQLKAWARTASAEELYQRAVQQTAHWPEPMKEAIKLTGAKGIHTPTIRFVETDLPSDTLPEGRVTLLGDAAHSMVPFKGMGANKALEGSAVLGRAFISGADQGKPISEILRSYESEWIPQGRAAVLLSREAGDGPPEDMKR